MSEVESPPAGAISKERRFGVAISSALILGGGWWAAAEMTEAKGTDTLEYPVSGASVVVDARDADVEVRSGDVSQITVTRKTERNVFSSDPEEKYEGGRLELRKTGCGFLSFGTCDTNYLIVVPREVAVRAESSSGDLTAAELLKGVDLRTTSGSIEVRSVGGDVQLKTSSGGVEGQELADGRYVIEVSSGDIDLRFRQPPASVDAESSSGDVSIEVPAGDQAYAVDADTSSGDTESQLKQDPCAERKIRAKSSSGDVLLEYADN
ncbi:MAG: DUF4097 family beta strand repeat-containing protein [Nocardioidaceae bacterium]